MGLFLGDGFPASSAFKNRFSFQGKSSRISLTSDDSSLEYRRKSAGSPHNINVAFANNNNNNYSNANNNDAPYIYAFDEVERHADGTVVLR